MALLPSKFCRFIGSDGRADDEKEEQASSYTPTAYTLKPERLDKDTIDEYTSRIKEEFERMEQERQKTRGVPKSDTPPLTELPGQGRCVGYIVAQRTWPVDVSRAVITSGYDAEWLPGEPIKARDPGPTMMGYGAGLYAMKLGEEIVLPVHDGLNHLYAAGLVALWGRIKEHERGFRAEWAYPLEFQHLSIDGPFHDAMLAVLNERYGCRKHSERVKLGPADSVVVGIHQSMNPFWRTNMQRQTQQGLQQLLLHTLLQLNAQQIAAQQQVFWSKINNPGSFNP